MSSQWPELTPETDRGPRRALVVAVCAAVSGGAVGWTLLFVGLGLWGLAVGAVVLLFLAATGSRLHGSQRMHETVALSLACGLLSWPPPGLLAPLVRYWATGQSIGS